MRRLPHLAPSESGGEYMRELGDDAVAWRYSFQFAEAIEEVSRQRAGIANELPPELRQPETGGRSRLLSTKCCSDSDIVASP